MICGGDRSDSEMVIRIENLSKLYRLGQVGTTTLGEDLTRWWHRLRGKDDPFAIVGQANHRETKGDSDFVWALEDINLEIKRGERLGIIGANGAGKSTLLKILSKVTGPTTGSLKVRGRLASLLEVGTGFHPEMTGRENIYMNGAILGMTRREIKRKFDDIIDFAGVARYVDTPVKRYSSGMTVRLGFAVAAHLEPDILVVDEVLAVGDAEFQKRAIGKMEEVSNQEGRTILFVSHDMRAINKFCERVLLLGNGRVTCQGATSEVVKRYLQESTFGTTNPMVFEDDLNKPHQITSVGVYRKDGRPVVGALSARESFCVRLGYAHRQPIPRNLYAAFYVSDPSMQIVLFSDSRDHSEATQLADCRTRSANNSDAFSQEYEVEIPAPLLTPGRYWITPGLAKLGGPKFDEKQNAVSFEIIETAGERSTRPGVVNVYLKWQAK